jgi:hypothetical protein
VGADGRVGGERGWRGVVGDGAKVSLEEGGAVALVGAREGAVGGAEGAAVFFGGVWWRGLVLEREEEGVSRTGARGGGGGDDGWFLRGRRRA